MAAVQVGPTFKAMYDDLGGELPGLTVAFLSPIVLMVLGLLPFMVVGGAIGVRAEPKQRTVAAIVAVVLALLFPAAFLVAMYLPLFQLTSAIKP
jgi:type II secretory pathway component PulF